MSFVDPIFFIFLLFSFSGFHILNAIAARSEVRGIPMSALAFLFVVSVYFYGYFRPEYLFLLLGSSLAAWIFGLLMGGNFLNNKNFAIFLSRKLMMVLAIAILLFPLLLFKYTNFFIATLRDAGFSNLNALALALPLGISFFTFQNISYVTDVYRRSVSVERNFLKYGLYISFFPQLVAGPIVTAGKFIPQLFNTVKFSEIPVRSAMFYLLSGYIKKAVLADRLALVADPVFADSSQFGWIGLVSAVLAYSFQIYFDFSGYSDIAIGTGYLFGIELPENFNFPYASPGFKQFWRRWHITLSVWLRDHIYIPLGGNRHGVSRMMFSLIITMLLGGLWHGAHWNFVIWGFAHGILLVVDRFIPESFSKIAPLRQIYITVTFVLTTMLWILFRSGSEAHGFQRALDMYQGIFLLRDGAYVEGNLKFVLETSVLVLVFTFIYQRVSDWLLRAGDFSAAAVFSFLILLVVYFAPRSTSFIYFVF